jgi:16S rRNA (guanine966-N2)-methyltransferase
MAKIRIIGGRWRGRKLAVPEIDGLRPTSDRIRETLFNWLMHEIADSHCLDLFAGTGSLGLEALSRQAKKVSFIELNAAAAKQLQASIASLGITSDQAEVVRTSADTFLTKTTESYQIIFIDPPFGYGWQQKAIDLLVCSPHLCQLSTLVYIEQSATRDSFSIPSYWQLKKQKHTQGVIASLYQCG